MKLYSYVVVHDGGFAPNPFHGCCTLATCKPKIRLRAQVGDWVIGTGSVRNVGNGRLIYTMQVDEVLTYAEYGRDRRFQTKIPRIPGSPDVECGDNIYYERSGELRQRKSFHGPEAMATDLGGKNVLVSHHFYYFGRQALPVPKRFAELVRPGRGHRCRFDEGTVRHFIKWLTASYEPGLHGLPWRFCELDLETQAACRPTRCGTNAHRKC